jgi:hypothetical protein
MASVLTQHSLDIHENDEVWMTGELPGLPLMEALYE